MVLQDLSEPNRVAQFRLWLASHGAQVHPGVYFQEVPSGFCIIASESIPSDETILSCPFSLAITPEVAKHALQVILQGTEDMRSSLKRWSERQLICVYIVMHDLVPDSHPNYHLFKHLPYIRMLPSPDVLSTSLHFSPEELTLFGGSNLYGATNDRRSAWQSEWEVCQHVIQAVNPEWGTQLTWSKYLTAATYISSRAFPSTLLSPNPSLKPSPTSHPVLLPGIDSLNHARAHPVSWVVNKPVSSSSSSHEIQDQDLLISLVLHQPTEGGSELFNNYGPKPNSELILGYGFSLPNNPDDTIVLKIGGYPPSHPNANRKWEVGRDASGIKEVWRAILEAVTTGGSEEDEDQECDSDDQDVHDPRDQLYATKLLSGMADGLLNRLPSEMVEQSSQAVQPGVQEMFQHYITGQKDILGAIIQFAKMQEIRLVELIEELGLDMNEDNTEEDNT